MQLRLLAFGMITAGSMSLVAACHREEPSSTRAEETQLRSGTAPAGHACPMNVPATTVSASDTASGVMLEFTTTAGAGAVADLQRRVHTMADAGTLGTMRGPGGGRGQAGRVRAREASGVARPHVRVENTMNGARVSLDPTGTESIEALRTRVRAHATRMASNDACMHARSLP